MTDACKMENGGCSQNCIFTENILKKLCICNNIYTLNGDGKLCQNKVNLNKDNK